MNSGNIGLFVVLGSLLFSCNGPKEKHTPTNGPKANTYIHSEHIIEAEELLKSEKENIRIIDFRKPQQYAEHHIKGALNIWRAAIEDTSYPYGGMMAKKQDIEALFGQLGIKNEDIVVVYDNKGSSDAARLWWVLKNYNFESVRILNGGLDAWIDAGGNVSRETITMAPSEFSLPTNGSMGLWIGKDELLEIISSGKKAIVLDARSEDEFSGKIQKKGAAKGGRISKSIHIDWSEAIDYEGTKKLRSLAELEKIYKKMGASKTDLIIPYCHSGARSALTTFVLSELLGYKNVKNYDGSWTEWSYFDDLPYEKDSTAQLIQ